MRLWPAALLVAACSSTPKPASPAHPARTPDPATSPPDVAFRDISNACTARRDYASCAKLAVMYWAGVGTAPDHGAARELAKTACDRSVAVGCTELGIWTLGGSPAQAVALLQEGCDGGDPQGCGNLGVLYETGTGVALDKAKAVELLTRACDGDDGLGCTNLGGYYATLAPPDDAKARAMFERACKLEHAQGCANLADFLTGGRGGAADEPRAIEVTRKACDLGSGLACANLGQLYLHGEGGLPTDPKKAALLFVTACDLQAGGGCLLAGAMFAGGVGVAVDVARAKALVEKACKLGAQDACDVLKSL
jgi:hypothetical protein